MFRIAANFLDKKPKVLILNRLIKYYLLPIEVPCIRDYWQEGKDFRRVPGSDASTSDKERSASRGTLLLERRCALVQVSIVHPVTCYCD